MGTHQRNQAAKSVGVSSQWGPRGTMEVQKTRMVVRSDFCNRQLQCVHIFFPLRFLVTHNTVKEDSLVLFLIEVTTEAEPPHLGTRHRSRYRLHTLPSHFFDTFIVTRCFTRFEYSIICLEVSRMWRFVELWWRMLEVKALFWSYGSMDYTLGSFLNCHYWMKFIIGVL